MIVTAAAAPKPEGPPIVYLLSQYPAITHTFLLREVLALRKLGVDIRVVSIKPADRQVAEMEGAECEEALATFYVKPEGFWKSLAVHAKFLLRHPGAWLRGLIAALHLSRRNPAKVLNNLFYFAEAIVVGCWMESKRSTHLHTHFVSTVALIVKKVFPITYSMTIHGPEEFDDAIGFHLSEKMAEARMVVAISYYCQSQLMRASTSDAWDKIRVIPLGVNPADYHPSPRPKSDSVFRLFCVARLSPVKAQLILLQALHRVIASGRILELHLVGGGTERALLERKTAELGLSAVAVFHGPTPQAQVLELLRTADAFALVSFAEGVPVALMEAMSLEIPCIASCVMGVPELIRDGIDGLLVAPSDVEGVSTAIAKLIDDPSLRTRLGKSARDHVLARYDLSRNTERMAQLFREHMFRGINSKA